MYELKKNWKGIYEQIFFGTGPSSYKKRIYRAVVSQRLRNTGIEYPPAKSWNTHDNHYVHNYHTIRRYIACDVQPEW